MSATPDHRVEAAAAWLAKLQSRVVTNAQLAEFARWRRDPENEAAYRAAEGIWERSLALEGDPIIEHLLAQTGRSANAAGWDRARRFGPEIAGVVAAGAAVLVWVLQPSGPAQLNYHTVVGERSAAVLSDGSKIAIDTDSLLTARLADGKRMVDLRRGQAFFDVRHDPARPFVVSAGDNVTITALGTRFDVRRLPRATRVALQEGSVQVAFRGRVIVVLLPGQSVEVTRLGAVRRLGAPVGQILSWRQARLSFRSTPLGEAVDEMNRYTQEQISIVDRSRSRASVSGDFSVDDPEGFTRAVNALFGAGTVTPPTGGG